VLHIRRPERSEQLLFSFTSSACLSALRVSAFESPFFPFDLQLSTADLLSLPLDFPAQREYIRPNVPSIA